MSPVHVPVFDERRAAESLNPHPRGRTGVLLVNHGSRSDTWRRMLLDVHAGVQERLLALPGLGGVRTAFMEYTEPSIASQLAAFDRDGFERIILVPLLLTVSTHSAEDIPAIYGAKSDARTLALLQAEGIARYTPNADVVMTPLLDYPALVKLNIQRRIASLRAALPQPLEHTRDGLVLVGYGSEEFNADWESLFQELCDFAEHELRVTAARYSWCGHLVGYKKTPTINAINAILEVVDRAFVLPILVAFDELFQNTIIGGAVERVDRPDRVIYKRDAILPEPELNRWIVEIVTATLRASPR